MGSNKSKEKITLESLLHLKRNEKPAVDFWDSFEEDFHRRRLHALVEQGSSRNLFLNPVFRYLAVALPTALLVGATIFWSSSRESPTSRMTSVVNEPVVFDTGEVLAQAETIPSASDNDVFVHFNDRQVSNQFVVDAIQSSEYQGSNFRKVLYTPAIRLSNSSGTSYVRDNLGSSDYRVTTADLKLGRNF